MKNINSISIVSIILILVSIGILLFLVKPIYQKFQIAKTQLSESQTELEYRQEYVKQIADITKRLNKDKDSIDKLNFALPENISIASLFNFLQAAAQKNGLLLTDVTMPTEVPLVLKKKVTGKSGRQIISKQRTNLTYYTFNTTIQGPYNYFKGFVSDLEKSARMIEIDDISFGSNLESNTSSIFSYDLALKVYSFHK